MSQKKYDAEVRVQIMTIMNLIMMADKELMSILSGLFDNVLLQGSVKCFACLGPVTEDGPEPVVAIVDVIPEDASIAPRRIGGLVCDDCDDLMPHDHVASLCINTVLRMLENEEGIEDV